MGLFNGENNSDDDKKLLEQVADASNKDLQNTDGIGSKAAEGLATGDGNFWGKLLDASLDKDDKSKKMISDWWNHTTELYSNMMEHQNENFNNIINKKYDEALVVTNEIIGSILDNLGVPGNLSNPYKLQSLLEEELGKPVSSATGSGSLTESGDIVDLSHSGASKTHTNSLFAFRNPSDKQYEKCLQAKGLSVWDPNGFWRCLFPQQYISKHKLSANELSREEVEGDNEHKLGVFFKDYTGYLSWRNHMMNIKKQKLAKQLQEHELATSGSNSFLATESDVSFGNNPANLTDREIVGKSSSLSYTTTDEGREQIKETKIYYNSGTKTIKERKFFPADGSEVIKSQEETFIKK